MAAISDLQAESVGSNLNQLFWTDNGQTNTLKRAPHGGSYSTLATVTGTTTYQDSAVTAGVYYDYKITSAVGGDSNVSSVVTQVCDLVTPESSSIAGQYAQDQVTPQDFNNLIDDLNKKLQAENNQDFPCEVCPTNGAVVLDCTQCTNFTINVISDINSISMIGCDNIGDGTINLVVPAGTNPKVCGFLVSLGFDGSECSKNPGTLAGHSSGAVYPVRFGARSVSGAARHLTSKGLTGGTPGGGALLTLTCQTSVGGANSNCSMACSGVKAMKVVASGGVPPYTFSATGGLGVSVAGATATITPPTNSSPGTAGTAYKLYIALTSSSSGSCFNNWISSSYGCNDNLLSSSNGNCDPADTCNNGGALPGCASIGCLSGGTDSCNGSNIICSPPPQPPGTRTNAFTPVHAPASTSTGFACDKRTGAMISAGCVPCGVSVPTQVVTVRDATGAQVSKTLVA